MLCMMNIRKFTLSGGLVLNCSAGAFSVANAYMLLPQYRRFAGYDLASDGVASSFPQLVLIFPCRVMNKELDIIGDTMCSKLSPYL